MTTLASLYDDFLVDPEDLPTGGDIFNRIIYDFWVINKLVLIVDHNIPEEGDCWIVIQIYNKLIKIEGYRWATQEAEDSGFTIEDSYYVRIVEVKQPSYERIEETKMTTQQETKVLIVYNQPTEYKCDLIVMDVDQVTLTMLTKTNGKVVNQSDLTSDELQALVDLIEGLNLGNQETVTGVIDTVAQGIKYVFYLGWAD